MSVLDKWRNRSSLNWTPLQASLELTYRCNERCTHCYIDDFRDDKNRILSLEDWDIVLSKLKDAGTLYLILMGGEAMLNPLFWDICRLAQKKGFHTSMITNGLKVKTLEIAKELKAVGIKNVALSVYSLRDEIHDKMTAVRGSLKRMMKTIEYCDKAGIQVGINCLLTKANIEHYMELAVWCVERGYEIKVDPTVTPKLNGNLDPLQYRATKEQLENHYKEMLEKWPKSLPKKFKSSAKDFVCNAAKGKCAISPYGELLPCIEIRESMGNMVTDDWETIWNGKASDKWRLMKMSDIKGANNEQLNYCDFCPGMSHNEHGDKYRPTDHGLIVSDVRSKINDTEQR